MAILLTHSKGSGAYFDQDYSTVDDVPELGRDETPPLSDSCPSTPDVLSPTCKNLDHVIYSSSPTKSKGTGRTTKSSPAVEITSYDSSKTIEEPPVSVNNTYAPGPIPVFQIDGHFSTAFDPNAWNPNVIERAPNSNTSLHSINFNFSQLTSTSSKTDVPPSLSVLDEHWMAIAAQKACSTTASRSKVKLRKSVDKASGSKDEGRIKPVGVSTSTLLKQEDCNVQKQDPREDQWNSNINNTTFMQNRTLPTTHNEMMSESLAKILPYDTIQRLLANPRQCVSSRVRSRNVRCGHRLPRTRENTEELLERYLRLEDSWTIATAVPLIQAILIHVTCNAGRHRKIAGGLFQELLDHIHGYSIKEPDSHLTLKDFDAIPRWIVALTTLPLGSTAGTFVAQQPSLVRQASKSPQIEQNKLTKQISVRFPLRHGFEQTEVGLTLEARTAPLPRQSLSTSGSNWKGSTMPLISADTAIGQGFVPYLSEKNRGLPVKEAIYQEIRKPLTPQEQNISGFIYMYWVRGNFGYLKIGVTFRNIQVRLKEWERKCGHDIESCKLMGVSEIDNVTSTPIPHIHRVERLVRTELRNQRRKEVPGCKKCHEEHKEWFCVDAERAKAVVLKWSRWMTECQPYGPCPPASVKVEAEADLATAQGKDVSSAACTDDRTVTKATPGKADVPYQGLIDSITESEIEEMCEPVRSGLLKVPAVPAIQRRRSESSLRRIKPSWSGTRRSSGIDGINLGLDGMLAAQTTFRIEVDVTVKSEAITVERGRRLEDELQQRLRVVVVKDVSQSLPREDV